MNLLALLEERNVIDKATVERTENYAQKHDVSYERALVSSEGLDAEIIRKAIGDYFSIPTESITDAEAIDIAVLRYVPEESARHYKILPLRIVDGILEVGITDPENLTVRDALNFIAAKHQIPYRLKVILESDLEVGLQAYENLAGEVDEVLDELESSFVAKQEKGQEDFEAAEKIPKKTEHIKEDAPITKIVATILRYAVDGLASDIHIEPTGKKVVVRFRVDGILQNSLELPMKVHQAVVARVKILSSLRLDEKRKPQDGRFSATIDNRKIDFRVSVLPTNHGEKVVMRILDTEVGIHKLEDTGVSKRNIELIRKAIQQPYGIILISGPTGSGKTTTLYSMLEEIDRVEKNVLSLEDPVEYNIDGVSQSQVRPEIGYTFANGLRTALRQDPDVIMVGEIRDGETAKLAIQAALTGHLVLSTIHTNTAAGVVPRLIDMGVDPYLIAPTLKLAIAQRLVRRICPDTGRKTPIEGSLKRIIEEGFKDVSEEHRHQIPPADYVLYIEPTQECTSGTKGRVAAMEAFEITPAIEHLILEEAPEEAIIGEARKDGFMTMREDAMIKALEHSIPFEEISTLGGALLVSDEAEDEANGETVDNQKVIS